MDKNLAREKKKRLIITFETTTAPLKLDIKGKACGIPGRTIPLPSVISAGCGLAWRAELSDRECLIAFMKEHDISHWGIEGDHYPNDYQQAAAHRIIDWGADLVVGNHPHVLQGMEVYNGKMICYSLGNFCFGGNKNPADKNTAIYQQAFTLINGELQPGIDAQIIPCTLSSVSSYNDFRPTVASGEKAQEICNLMNTYSQNCSNIEIDELGNLHVN